MHTITLTAAISKYGLCSYLSALRGRFHLGHYTFSEYALLAAAAYCADNKPLRGRAMLSTLDSGALTPAQSLKADEIDAEIGQLPFDAHSRCSLNMITKNEQEGITAALDSVDTIMDEIVICDTGSTDATVERARLYGATIVHDPWHDDFSRARNRAIDESRCDWIFWLDGDDRLDPACAKALQAFWRQAPPQAAAFCVVNRLNGSADVPFLQTRLFPRRDRLRFERRIHEQIMFSARAGGIPLTRCEAIRIIHSGYLDPLVHHRKARRNMTMIAAELPEHNADPALRLSLADCHWILGEYDEAFREYAAVAGNEDYYRRNSDVFAQAHINCGLIAYKQQRYSEARRYFYRALYLDATRIEAFYHLALLHKRNNNPGAAISFFIKAATLSPPLRLTATNNLTIRLESIYQLADCLIDWARRNSSSSQLLKSIRGFRVTTRNWAACTSNGATSSRRRPI
jgi:glycosyltransferase involved in cell wall biosynthesis